jgi:hypothetical protein
MSQNPDDIDLPPKPAEPVFESREFSEIISREG